MAEFFERAIDFLPEVEVCCYSLSLFVGAIMGSLCTLGYFFSQYYKSKGFWLSYYIPQILRSANGIVGIIHMLPTICLLICAIIGFVLNSIFIVGFFTDVPVVVGLSLVFFGVLVVLLETIWVLFAFIRVFLGGGALTSCNASHNAEFCTDDIAAFGFCVIGALATYCFIVIKSYILDVMQTK